MSINGMPPTAPNLDNPARVYNRGVSDVTPYTSLPCGCHGYQCVPARVDPDGVWHPVQSVADWSRRRGIARVRALAHHATVDGVRLFCVHGEV